jgi:hypothetical protein
MDKSARYRDIIKHIVFEYAKHKPRYGEIETEVFIDEERDHYKVMRVGWRGERRIYGSVIHLDIINDKVWVQYDGTDRPVVDALLEAGVPHEDIVLGFHPPEVRQYTEFAAA